MCDRAESAVWRSCRKVKSKLRNIWKKHEQNKSEKPNQALPILFFINQRKERECFMYSGAACSALPG